MRGRQPFLRAVPPRHAQPPHTCSLLAIAKQQGAVGTATRGACKICGQTGHLTKQCRNALPGAAGGEGDGGGAGAATLLEAPPADDGADSLDLSSDSSDEERRRCGRGAACFSLGVVWWLAAAGQ